ncbi:MAG: LysM peptidoglycan-binding domain-containing protein [Lewinellaceae bacterium]|nr:LysM peptidoglycan-binding domain-containing protein [Lewinellaceae bacterium]
MNLVKNILPVAFFWLSCQCLYGQTSPAQSAYIDRFKDIAIREMARTGIPASITLAQGILESNAGSSELAVQANNHFGIKCGSDWNGAAYFKKDDDYSPEGYLMESCFRSYPTAEGSFVDHSSFIISPQKASRYGFLFQLAPSDYKGWANGLQQAGYATSLTYAAQLIGLIERYGLSKYDQPPSEPATPAVSPIIATTNNVTFTLASGYETASDIALRTQVSVGDLLVYNENLPTGYLLPAGQKVYLAPKRRAFRGPVDTHIVQPSETMYDIAQRYGIQLDKLRARNRLEPGQEPAAGEVIKLRGWKTKETPALQPSPTPTGTGPVFHTVVKGDTLWNIAQRYQTDVETLKRLNNLSDNLIRLGMQIRVQ